MSKIRIEPQGFAATIELPRPMVECCPMAFVSVLDEIGTEKGEIARISVQFGSDYVFPADGEDDDRTTPYLKLLVTGKGNENLAEVKIPLSELDEENQKAYDRWQAHCAADQKDEDD